MFLSSIRRRIPTINMKSTTKDNKEVYSILKNAENDDSDLRDDSKDNNAFDHLLKDDNDSDHLLKENNYFEGLPSNDSSITVQCYSRDDVDETALKCPEKGGRLRRYALSADNLRESDFRTVQYLHLIERLRMCGLA